MFMLLLYFYAHSDDLGYCTTSMRTCYMLQCYMRTCYSYSVTVLLNMLLGYCIYVYAYMLHTCECATERLGAMGLGPGGWGKQIGVAVAVAVAPPFLRFWEC